MLKPGFDGKKRCFGNSNLVSAQYHDTEWGVPVHCDRTLFEMLILEGAQAGLSWDTVLMKRDGYRESFHNFDVQKVANMSDSDLESNHTNSAIIRNKLKISSTRKNAIVFMEIQKEFKTFNDYIWKWVNYKTIVNKPVDHHSLNANSDISDAISYDLKKRGMSFVGSTIMYSYMQAVGLVNDHLVDCWCTK